jgi:hypothetical protein
MGFESFGPSFGFSGASFVPTNLSGLILWLRADLGVTQAGTVTAWADQSAAGNNFAPGTGPGFSASGGPLPSQPAITFNGTTQQLLNGTLAAPLSKTLVVVAKTTATSAAQYMAMFSGGAANGIFLNVGNVANKRNLVIVGVNNESDATANASTAWEAWVVSDTAALRSLRVNGAAHSLDVNNDTESAASPGASLGSYIAGSVHWGGSMWEVMAFNRVLNGTEIGQLEGYIQATTGIW